MKNWKKAMAAGMIGAMCICGCSTGQNGDTQDKTDYTNGAPWLCSVMEGNVTEDTSAELKDDFYLAICKDDILNLEIPAGQSANGFQYQGAQKAEKDIKEMFGQAEPESHDEKLAYDLYGLLMDWDTRDEIGTAPLTDTLEGIEKIKSIEELTAYIVDTPIRFPDSSLWSFSAMKDLLDSSQNIGVISPPSLLMEDSGEYEEMTEMGSIRKDAKSTLAVKILVKSGYSEQEAKAKVENALEFEKLLAKGIFTEKEQNSPDYLSKVTKHYTHEEIKEAAGAAPIVDYLLKKIGVSENQEYLLMSPQYLDTLAEVYKEENLDLIKDYLMVHSAIDFSGYLDRESYESYWECRNAISGASTRKDDETIASTTVSNILQWPTAKLYAATYLNEEDKQRITEFVEDILDEYHEVLNNADFLSDEAKASAIEKLETISMRILYPDDWSPYSCEKLDFKGKEDGGTVLDALNAVGEFYVQESLEELDKPVDKTEWDYPPTFYNCSYDPQTNSITIYGAFTNGGSYRSDMTDEEMYAYLGFPSAHEITHAFDATGSQFDKDGNFNDWWSEEDRAAFNEKNQKLIEYYDAIIPWEGVRYYGEVVCGEACADMGSIRCILNLAAKKENFDYDSFFRNVSHVWLTKYTKESTLARLTDVHPYPYLRVNCTLQQYQEFLDFYDIKEGDNMYLAPEDRVAIW